MPIIRYNINKKNNKGEINMKKKLLIIIALLLVNIVLFGEEIDYDNNPNIAKASKIIRKDNADFMVIDIYYDSKGRLLREVLRNDLKEIVQILDFKEYNVKDKPRKAVITDFNNIKIGFYDLIYDIKGNLIKAIQKDLHGNLVRNSYISEHNEIFKEIITDKSNRAFREKTYGIGEVIQIIDDRTEDIVHTENFKKNGEIYTKKVYYDLTMRPKEEIIYDRSGRKISNYRYVEYFDSGRPKNAEIIDINGNLIGYMTFNYDSFNNISSVTQIGLNGNIIKHSEFQKGHNKYVETWKNNERDIITKLDYYFNDDFIEIIEKKDKEYYNNQDIYSSLTSKSEKDYLRQEKILSIPAEDRWKTYNIDYYLDIREKKETEKIKNYDKSRELLEYNKILEKRIDKIYNTKLKDKIGFSELDYYITYINIEETIIGQIITDAIKAFTEYDIVLIDGSEIKTGIEAGEIYYLDIFNMFEKDDRIYFTSLYGSEIKTLLTGASKFGKNGHINTAGIYWEDSGNGNIQNIKINGVNLILDRKYSVVTNESIALKKNFYELIPSTTQFYRGKYPIFMIVADYIRELKVLDKSYILEKRHVKKGE